jgi:hypothetical protein
VWFCKDLSCIGDSLALVDEESVGRERVDHLLVAGCPQFQHAAA